MYIFVFDGLVTSFSFTTSKRQWVSDRSNEKIGRQTIWREHNGTQPLPPSPPSSDHSNSNTISPPHHFPADTVIAEYCITDSLTSHSYLQACSHQLLDTHRNRDWPIYLSQQISVLIHSCIIPFTHTPMHLLIHPLIHPISNPCILLSISQSVKP